jgi:hypothetical protein
LKRGGGNFYVDFWGKDKSKELLLYKAVVFFFIFGVKPKLLFKSNLVGLQNKFNPG